MLENIIIDAREFNSHKLTGIGRVLSGLVLAMSEYDFINKITLAACCLKGIPIKLLQIEKVDFLKIPAQWINSEFALTKLSNKGASLLLSPYPKFPLTGCHCPTINMVHDVFFITHPAYQKKIRNYIEKLRLKIALKKADLTWFVSNHSLQETKKIVGFINKKSKVRYSAIDPKFDNIMSDNDSIILQKYGLNPGYILVIGNGKPHKNLGILLEIKGKIKRNLVFVGIWKNYISLWKKKYPKSHAVWINFIDDDDLPAIIRNSFCIAQPSTEEGYGFPPMEAMACGTPTVVSKIPVLTETTNGCALTADPFDSNTWLEAFNALENESFRQFQIKKGIEWVQNFKGSQGWKAHIEDIRELFEKSKF